MFYHAAKLQKHFNHTRKNTESFSPFDLSTKKGVFSYKYDHFCDFQANKTIKYTLMFK